MRHKWAACLAFIVCLAFATGASAQDASGNLYGTVVNQQGQPLPGVTVTLLGPGVPMVHVTDANGQFRFLNLDPSEYRIVTKAQGYATLEYPNVRVTANRSTTIDATLSSSVQDIITVTAEAPLLDERAVRTETSATLEELERIPTARDPWAILRQTPGVLTDRINVGGSEAGLFSQYIRAGSLETDSVWAVDGVNITDMSAIGATPTFYDFGALEELQATTGGSDAQLPSGGVLLNMVTKRGTNDWRGSARVLLSSGGDFDDEDFQQPGGFLYGGGGDLGFEYGGPLIPGRLWVWGSAGHIGVSRQTFAETEKVNADFRANTITGKLTAQVTPANTLTGFISMGRWNRDAVDAGPTRPLETTWNQSGPTNILKIEDAHIFNSNFYISGMAAFVSGGFELDPRGGTNTPFELVNDVMRGGYYRVDSDRTAKEFRLDSNYFLNTGEASHELRFGVGRRGFSDTTVADWPSGTFTFFEEGIPNPIAVFPTVNEAKFGQSYSSFYAQDTLTIGNLTANLGLRYDSYSVENKSSAISPNPLREVLVPGGSFEGDELDLDWSGISPRLGLTYDLFGNGRARLYGSWSRFLSQAPTQLAAFVNPIEIAFPFLGAEAFQFVDANNNRRFDETESRGPSLRVGVRADDPDFFTTPNQFADDVKGPHTNEFLGGIEFDVLRSIALGARLTHRSTDNITDSNLLVDDFANIRVNAPTDYQPGPILVETGVDDDVQIVPTARLRLDRFFTGGVERSTGDREQSYTAVTLTFNKRLANRWMLRGYVNFQDWTWSVPDTFFFDGNDLRGSEDDDDAPVMPTSPSERKDGVFLSNGWTYNVNGLYQIAPDRPWGFNLAANLTGQDGRPIAPFIGAELGDGLSRDLQVGDPDEFKYDAIHLLDARVDKTFTFQDVDVTVGFDIFNFLSNDTTLQSVANLASPDRLEPTEIVTPRIFRFGVRIAFR